MPKLSYAIGTLISDAFFGESIILGYKYPEKGGSLYHVYMLDHNYYAYSSSDRFTNIRPPTPDSIELAQRLLLEIPNLPEIPNSELKVGTVLTVSCSFADDNEYIVLDNGQIVGGILKFLVAFHTINTDTWFLQYFAPTSPMYQKAKITLPTDTSVKLAKKLLFERVIAPAFTV